MTPLRPLPPAALERLAALDRRRLLSAYAAAHRIEGTG
jgi:hypothetical protein